MGKKTTYTNITPLPVNIPRQLVIDMLHNHGEIIELNPIVIDHRPIKAPRKAAADEFFSNWYEITERIDFLPGLGKLASSKVTFKGVFHDMPYGLQTHVYVPLGIDIRNKWQVKGNQPGEFREVRELGDPAPPEGLYLREDVEIQCNVTLTAFVKKGLIEATGILVQRLMKKAELLDAGTLQAMFSDGKLTTVNPALSPDLNQDNRQSRTLSMPSQSNSDSPAPSSHDQGSIGRTESTRSGFNQPSQSPYNAPKQFTAELYGSNPTFQNQDQPPQKSPYLQTSHPSGAYMELPGSIPVPGQSYPQRDMSNATSGLGISPGANDSKAYGQQGLPAGRSFAAELE